VREHLKTFFTALMFLTRIPCPRWVDHAPDSLAKSTMYFPLVGLLVGGLGACVSRLIGVLYPPLFAVLCGLSATVVVTGAFHEDAFADVCDGFGGWTPERRLEIMRDSRVGSFGVVGLVLLIGAKIALLSGLGLARVPLAFLAGHTLARWSTLVMIARFPSVTDSASMAAPFASAITLPRFLFATLIALLVSLLCGPASAAIMFVLTLLLCFGAGRFFNRWVGGISGDCLGAVNQVTELLCYAVLAASLKG
jgi:adenosylcobinamide-GDP ribazoletransferase